jgi:hypothetical protein
MLARLPRLVATVGWSVPARPHAPQLYYTDIMPPSSVQEISPIAIERYKYILQQIHSINENVYRFLTIFQTLGTAIVSAALALFVSYSSWGINPETARIAIHGLLVLLTFIACFTVLLVVSGIVSWIDYRKEECSLTEQYLGSDFRTPPRLRNFYRWYETYIIAFVIATTIALWVLGEWIILPRIR